MRDPVHQNEDGYWYFWDEVWVEEYGPFETEEIASEEMEKYCRML